MFVLIYLNQDGSVKNLMAKNYTYEKVLPKLITSLSMERAFMGNPLIDIKRYDEIRKSSTRQGKVYTTGYMLDF